MSSQLRHVLTIGKKFVNQQYLLHMSSQCGELWPTNGWDTFGSLGIPANFNGFHVLAALLYGTLVVGVSQTAALNKGRYLYSAGRPSRWALAHISSFDDLTPEVESHINETEKGTCLRESASFESSCAKIRRPVWPVGEFSKRSYIKIGYISTIRPVAPRKRMCTKFGTSVGFADVITCDIFLAIG